PPEFRRPFSHPDQGEYAAMLQAFKKGKLKGDEIYFNNRLSPDGVLSGIAEYDNEIAYADQEMGRFLDVLKAQGLYDDALIAVVSDHGESLGEHDLFFAHSFFLYQEIQQAVMVLKPPRSRSAKRIAHPVRLLDLMPTIMSMLEVQPPRLAQGVDLSPLWTGSPASPFPDLPVYAESEPRYRSDSGIYRYPSRKRASVEGDAGKWRMMRYKDYKLIDIPGEGRELYNLADDPGESTNLIERSPQMAEQLWERIELVLREEPGQVEEERSEPMHRNEEAIEEIKAMGYGN
ncbi:MAG: sulfatase-like hydrolase/transferase, partial [Planctomycetes bacterium]|nr:sulfatase-like hydrolase/transferase [Planctomycetota bacterium]